MKTFTTNDAADMIWESLQSITVAKITSLSEGEGKTDLWYDSRAELFYLGSYDIEFNSVQDVLEWYSDEVDSEFSIEIKEL